MSDGDDIRDMITAATKKWTKQKKAEERHVSARGMRQQRMQCEREMYLTEALTWIVEGTDKTVMEMAYLKASANGTLPANARQVMYAARPMLQELTNRPVNDQYFTQTLLPDYIRLFDLDWDIAFDDRGHYTEPHTDREIGLGTLNVRSYLASIHTQPDPNFTEAGFANARVETLGPNASFKALLFIEKEGFRPLLKAAKIAERYDLAIMSSKGMSVTAARNLAEEICGRYGVKLLILHDFDRAGMIIKHTLHNDTRRYTFTKEFEVIDLGLRLSDVEAMGLESEDPGGSKVSDYELRKAGATEEEIKFLKQARVELNAMPSDQFIEFLEKKLEENGIAKIVPDAGTLAKAYTMFVRSEKLRAAFDEAEEAVDSEENDIEVPDDIAEQVTAILAKRPTIPWHQAVESLTYQNARDDEEEDEGDEVHE
jgi:hypothetical protein